MNGFPQAAHSICLPEWCHAQPTRSGKRIRLGDISGNGGRGPKFKLANIALARLRRLEDMSDEIKAARFHRIRRALQR